MVFSRRLPPEEYDSRLNRNWLGKKQVEFRVFLCLLCLRFFPAHALPTTMAWHTLVRVGVCFYFGFQRTCTGAYIDEYAKPRGQLRAKNLAMLG